MRFEYFLDFQVFQFKSKNDYNVSVMSDTVSFGFFNNSQRKYLTLQRILLMISLFVVITGCSEIFQPEVEYTESFLAVEGSITTKPGEHIVLLSFSRSYNEKDYFTGLEGADVSVVDENGNRVHYDDVDNGIYRAYITAENAAKIGSTYYLEIVTGDGVVFRSTPQLVVSSPEVKRLYCEYDARFILSENSYGDVIEQEYPVITLKIDIDGILPSDNYYLYNHKAYLQCHNYFIDELGMIYEKFHHLSLSSRYSGNIHTINADEYGNFSVRNDEYMYITLEDLRNYDPYNPDSAELDRKRFEGLLIKLNQYSLSPDAYTFYRDVEEQLDAEGRLFDPSFTQLTGNIQCVSEEEQKVIGVFYAADISDYYACLYINSRNQTYSTQIDSFPELLLDTSSSSMPDDWIRTPN